MGKFSAFDLPLKSLPVGEHTFTYHLGEQFFKDMENADVRDADLNVDLKVVYNGEFYQLHFHITGEVVVLCDRCLDDLQYPIDAEYDIVVKYGEDFCDAEDNVLEIPERMASLNVSYMIHDTVALAIPIKHVHPLGKCNRQMTAMLKKHRATSGDEDEELENSLIDEMDQMDDSAEQAPSDPRWDALKKLNNTESED